MKLLGAFALLALVFAVIIGVARVIYLRLPQQRARRERMLDRVRGQSDE